MRTGPSSVAAEVAPAARQYFKLNRAMLPNVAIWKSMRDPVHFEYTLLVSFKLSEPAHQNK